MKGTGEVPNSSFRNFSFSAMEVTRILPGGQVRVCGTRDGFRLDRQASSPRTMHVRTRRSLDEQQLCGLGVFLKHIPRDEGRINDDTVKSVVQGLRNVLGLLEVIPWSHENNQASYL